MQKAGEQKYHLLLLYDVKPPLQGGDRAQRVLAETGLWCPLGLSLILASG